MSRLPELVVHADWGKESRKRWMAKAVLGSNGGFRAEPSTRVDDAGQLLSRLRASSQAGAGILAGFDFPIGLPRAYASRAGIRSFRAFLRQLSAGEHSEFFDVATRPEEISLRRPFYPQRPGGCKQTHLLEALGVSAMDELRRTCELAGGGRAAACSLFWTLGGNQTGKGAIAGWREVLIPELRDEKPGVSIWPFDGSLEALLEKGGVTVAETYPAEFYGHLGVSFPCSRVGRRSGKRVQIDRAANADALFSWTSCNQVELESGLRAEIEEGFGTKSDGEDRFDAVVGLFGMLNVVLRHRAPGPPSGDESVRDLEGWILGMGALERN